MHISYSFLIISFFASTVCSAMENNKKLPLTEITAVTSPRFVQYLDKDRAVIAGQSGCNIVDLKTNTILKKLNDFNYFDCKKSSNVKVPSLNKNRIITFYDNLIIEYNAQTGKQEWYTKDRYIRSIACDSIGETILVCYHDTGAGKYDKNSDQVTHFSGNSFYCAALHPTQKEVCLSRYPGPIYLYSFDDSSAELKKTFNKGYIVEYSPDGSYIASYDSSTLFFIDPTIGGEKYPHVKCGEKEDMRAEIAFYPYQSIVATISTESPKRITLIRYWDAKNRQLIESELHNIANPSQLAFSDDGLEYIMSTGDKCIQGNVPFKVRWHNKHHYFLFLLKNYLNQHPEITISNDIVCYVWRHFLL